MYELVPIIAIISTIALPIAVTFIVIARKISYDHKERMGMIQQGIIPPLQTKQKSTPDRYLSLRNGIIFIALGIGLTIGILGIQELGYSDGFAILFITASTVFFLGIGYLVFFLITRNIKDYHNLDLLSELKDEAE